MFATIAGWFINVIQNTYSILQVIEQEPFKYDSTSIRVALVSDPPTAFIVQQLVQHVDICTEYGTIYL